MGKPGAGNAASPRSEYIGPAEASQGTETSQYLEERKSTETPRVVASERGSAQTRQVQAGTRCLPGVVGRLVRAVPGSAEVTKPIGSRRPWNTATAAGNSPVGETGRPSGWRP